MEGFANDSRLARLTDSGPVAQLDRARGFVPRGCPFESGRGHHLGARVAKRVDATALEAVSPSLAKDARGVRVQVPSQVPNESFVKGRG